MKKLLLIFIFIFSTSVIFCQESNSANVKIKKIDGNLVDLHQVENSIEKILEKAGVTGLSCAIINDSQVVYENGFGFRNKDTDLINNENTIFAAASFSKTVFAYLVMLLVEEGKLDLDKPLQEYLNKPLHEYSDYVDLMGDNRSSKITARMVLSHTTGFPNLRFLLKDGKLKFLFDPGTRFSYSGEGFLFLQMVIEEITEQGLEELSRKNIFKPFGMNHTSYTWRDDFEENYAVPHDQYERPKTLQLKHEASAPGSMQSTAGDYARFMVGLLNANGKRKNIVSKMFEPQIAITSKRMFGPDAWVDTDENKNKKLSWTLGFGYLESAYGRSVFHTGHDIGWQNYSVVFLDKGIGVVLMSNSDNFESIARELVKEIIGDAVSPFDWLGYSYFDPNKDRTPPPEPIAIELEPDILKKYVGEYTFLSNKKLTIKMEDNNLFISDNDKKWLKLYAESEEKFFVKENDFRFQFIFNEAGNVIGYELLAAEDIKLSGDKIK
jgi:CubicO group peptidase (beta-lactamase class C family)